MDKIKTVKIKNEDGSISEETYTISVDAKNVDMANGYDLQDTIGNINIDVDGNIAAQLKKYKNYDKDIAILNQNVGMLENETEEIENNILDLQIHDIELDTDIKKKAYYFNTVADMKNANLKNGDMAITLGYYIFNDGGASLYKIKEKQISDNIDEGSLISIGTNLVAELITIDRVNYKQFGAKGDGVTNDYQYLYNTHVFANKNNLKVYGNPKDIYYIGLCENEIPVYTSTDFRNAKIIIDDSLNDLTYNEKEKSIFRIKSKNEMQNLYMSNLVTRETKTIDVSGLNLKSDAYIEIENSNKKQFIRSGENGDSGKNQFDNFRISADGRILDPILWNFESVTSAKIKEINDEPIEFKNVLVETIINEQESIYDYFWRNIRCLRSNVTFKNITHILSNEETTTSKPYNGFLYITECCNVLIDNCSLSAHKTYYTEGRTNGMGNYDIRIDKAINIKVNNCKQFNSITDTSKWGIYTSNYSKYLTISNSMLNRFDAHKGVANALIENSIIGYQGVRCVGFGDLTINNTKFIDTEILVTLRDDYGSFWRGNIKLNNIISECKYPSKKDARIIISGKNDGTHYFGYACYYPNIYIDGIEYHNAIDDTYNHFLGIQVFYIYNSGKGEITNNYNPIMGKEMVIKNAKCDSKKSSFVLFGSSTDIMLTKLYCEKDSLIQGRYVNDYYSRKKALEINTNFDIIVDNVDLFYQYSDVHDILGFATPNIAETFNLYNVASKRLLPNIKVSNCKNVYSYTNYPAVYNYYNCEVDRIYTPSNGVQSLSLVNFYNCIITLANYLKKIENSGTSITYSLLDNTKIICPANDKTLFENCYFKGLEQYQNTLGQAADSYIYKRIIFMFTFISTQENNSYLRNGYDLNNCKFSDQILYKETSINQQGFDVQQYFNSHEFKEELGLIPRKIGTTSEMPSSITITRASGNETINLTEGMTYINTSTDKYLVYLNNAWKELSIN